MLRATIYSDIGDSLTRFNPAIMELNDALTAVILSLPVKGHLYTGIYPVWPVFIAAVTANSDKRDCLYQRVVPIREGDKNTLPAVLKRVSASATCRSRARQADDEAAHPPNAAACERRTRDNRSRA